MNPERDRTLLVITDDRNTYRRLQADLAEIVSRTFLAENLDEGMRLARAERPALLLVSETLSDGTGLSFVRKLQDEAEHEGMRVVMLLEDADEYYRAAAIERGASGVISPRAQTQLVQTVVRNELRIHELWRRQEGSWGRDEVTGLMELTTFRDCAVSRLAGARRFGGRYWLLAVELTNLTAINAEHGFRAGDRVLRAIAEQLRIVTLNGDLHCRLHGGRFQLLVERSSDLAVETLIRRILDGALAARIYHELGLVVDFACRSVEADPQSCAAEDLDALIEDTISPDHPVDLPHS